MRERGENVQIHFDPKDPQSVSMTRQSFAKDADINNIMKKYAVTGVLVDPMNVDSSRVPRFGDFSDIPDYARLVARVQQAQSDFMTLSAEIRAKFQNDVQVCLEWISDPKNVHEAVKLGLLPKEMIPVTEAVVPPVEEGAVPPAPPTPVTPAS